MYVSQTTISMAVHSQPWLCFSLKRQSTWKLIARVNYNYGINLLHVSMDLSYGYFFNAPFVTNKCKKIQLKQLVHC